MSDFNSPEIQINDLDTNPQAPESSVPLDNEENQKRAKVLYESFDSLINQFGSDNPRRRYKAEKCPIIKQHATISGEVVEQQIELERVWDVGPDLIQINLQTMSSKGRQYLTYFLRPTQLEYLSSFDENRGFGRPSILHFENLTSLRNFLEHAYTKPAAKSK